MNTRASRPTETSAALTPEQKTSLKWLNAICVPGMYLDRLGPIRDYLVARLAAVAGEPQATTQGEPVYQIQRALAGDPLGTWRDATEEAYNLHMPDYRRILYAQAGTAAAPTDAEIRSLWQTTDTGDIEDDIMTFARALVSLQAGKPQDRAEGSKLATYPLEDMGLENASAEHKLFKVCDWQLTVGDVLSARKATGGTAP